MSENIVKWMEEFLRENKDKLQYAHYMDQGVNAIEVERKPFNNFMFKLDIENTCLTYGKTYLTAEGFDTVDASIDLTKGEMGDLILSVQCFLDYRNVYKELEEGKALRREEFKAQMSERVKR